ncbi:hypothetical protein [Butyrivibrio sp. LC3010]|uniref:hypothetical protein n=1 Tax=Butyrivibrio sp. LC3010 TaxID=1280680 RepID=UPI000407D710|nr:hypothetical protein [Butyrivibrio sp. LC3010]
MEKEKEFPKFTVYEMVNRNKIMKSFIKSTIAALCIIFIALAAFPISTYAKETDTKMSGTIYPKGYYSNWEGVSNVSQFKDENGNYCFASSSGKKVTIFTTVKGKVKKKLKLKMPYPIFGAVSCDQDGNYYVVSGRNNKTSNKKAETVFISKYSKTGALITTVGDNGSFGVPEYYTNDFNTKEPFAAGNCDIAINGNFVAVNYARHMYSGHQSNTALIINRITMQKQQLNKYYNSHSFAQRAIPYRDGFILASEGDAYNRAFSIAFTTPTEDSAEPVSEEKERSTWYYYDSAIPVDGSSYQTKEDASIYKRNTGETRVSSFDIFHFWLQKNASSNMFIVNNNFAHMGGIAVSDINHVALVGTSAKALNKKAKNQKESLFIQIFDPTKNLKYPDAYVLPSTRSGSSGLNGTEDVTDYGIKWLTNGKYTVANPQVVADHKGRFVILFEKYQGSYQGVYYTIIDQTGATVKKITRFSPSAKLNSCETPVCVGNTILWTANSYYGSKIYNYQLKVK